MLRNIFLFGYTILILIILAACNIFDIQNLTKTFINKLVIVDASTIKVNLKIVELSDKKRGINGICYSTINELPTINDSVFYFDNITNTGELDITIQNLTPGKNYYFRAFIIEEDEPLYSINTKSTLTPELPVLVTKPASSINSVSATLNGFVETNGLATNVYFEIGKDENYGKIYHAPLDPVTFDSAEMCINVNGLMANTTYHFRVYGTNKAGIVKASDLVFTTLKTEESTVTDIDGNIYNTIKIGQQEWMAENLKTIRYRNGDTIATTVPATLDISYTKEKYQWVLNGDNKNLETYGRMYNWYAINDDRGVCPAGWHVPGSAEWDTLINFVGEESTAGGLLKEQGTAHWTIPNTGANNKFGFNGLPCGYRTEKGLFYSTRINGIWWSINSISDVFVWNFYLYYENSYAIISASFKNDGNYVRCIKD
ncbi:MAG: fibrobacter succinogenes major paralogous domain-containing protein [Bacteroidales bacterium]